MYCQIIKEELSQVRACFIAAWSNRYSSLKQGRKHATGIYSSSAYSVYLKPHQIAFGRLPTSCSVDRGREPRYPLAKEKRVVLLQHWGRSPGGNTTAQKSPAPAPGTVTEKREKPPGEDDHPLGWFSLLSSGSFSLLILKTDHRGNLGLGCRRGKPCRGGVAKSHFPLHSFSSLCYPLNPFLTAPVIHS